MQILIRACILFVELIVVVVVAVGVISFLEKKKKSFGLAESDVFDLDGGFVAVVVEMEADDLKLG